MARYISKSIREDLMRGSGSASVSGKDMAYFIKEAQEKRRAAYSNSYVNRFRDGGVSGSSGKAGEAGLSGQAGTSGMARPESFNGTASTSSFAGQSVPEKAKPTKKKIDHNITEYKWNES